MNILVLKPCCLGDVLMTTPLLATLRAAYPDARIDYAVGDWARPALVTNPDLDELLPLFNPVASGWRRFAEALVAAFRLRWRRYDLAFIPDRDVLTSVVAYLAGVPRRFGLGGGGRGIFLTDRVEDGARRHDVDIYMQLAEVAGLKKHLAHELKYIPTQVSLERALQTLHDEKFDQLPFRVALFAGGQSSSGRDFHHKRWPAQRYALLANRLADRYGGGVILLGTEADRELNFQIQQNIDFPVLDLSGQTDIDGMGAIMQLCDAVISNDTGPMHLAVSVGTPTVGIFGPTSARKQGPYGAKHRAVQAHIYCGPCAGIGGPMEGCGAACIQRITVHDLEAVLETRAG